MVVLLLGTALHSLFFVLSERAIRNNLSAHRLCALMGCIEFPVLLVYNVLLGT